MRKRDAWEASRFRMGGNLALLFSELLIVGCALAWFASPSASIGKLLDPAWSASWSLGFGVFAVLAFIARLRRQWLVEVVCSAFIAISIWLWAVVILYVTVQDTRGAEQYGGLQTGLMFLAASAHRWGWLLIQHAWTRRVEFESDRLQGEVAAELRRRLEGMR